MSAGTSQKPKVLPPKPIPKPGHIKVVKALYKYKANYPDELSFDEGDVLYIIDMVTDPSWWKARCGERIGLIPSNYVEENTESIDHPLHDAAKRGNLSFLKECLMNKVSVNGLDSAWCTPLHWASRGGHYDIAMALLETPNVRLDLQNKLGDTPLHLAAWKGHKEIVEALVERRARIDLRNNEGKLAVELANDPAILAIHGIHLKKLPVPNGDGYGVSDDSD